LLWVCLKLGGNMTRPELFQKLDAVLAVAERERMFGTVEFELRDGRIILIRTVKTERIEDRGNTSPNVRQNYR
jgi:hypothetical protein